jgi:hypothetical protein
MADVSSGMSVVESLLGDRYTREARIAPAFLSVFPVVVLLMAWFSKLQELVPAILTLMCVFGVVRWISHITRAAGDRIEMEFFRKWGGKPTTTMLRVALGYEKTKDVQCDGWVKHLLREAPHAEEFRKLLTARQAPEIPSKSDDDKAKSDDDKAKEETGDHAGTKAERLDALYEPLVAWMRENSRGNNLVFEENISYGFQLNFYALKRFALWSGWLALVALVGVQAVVYLWFWCNHAWAMPLAVAAAILAANLLYLAGVHRFVSEKSVQVQGFIYARQLFDSFYGTAIAGGSGNAAQAGAKG